MATEEGIRSYGPGKFGTVVDSYVHSLSLEMLDEELGDVQDFGWHGRMRLGEWALKEIRKIAAEEDDELTPEEEELISGSYGAILSEDNQGFVDVEYFDDKKDLLEAWDALEDEAEEFYREEEEGG